MFAREFCLIVALAAGNVAHVRAVEAAQPVPACHGADLQAVVGQWIGATMHEATYLYVRHAGSGACTVAAVPAARLFDDASGATLWSRAAQADEAILQPGVVDIAFMEATNYCGPGGRRTFTLTLEFGPASGVFDIPVGAGPLGAACFIPGDSRLDILIDRLAPPDHPFAFAPPRSQPLGRLLLPETGAGSIAATGGRPLPAIVWLAAALLSGIGAVRLCCGSRARAM